MMETDMFGMHQSLEQRMIQLTGGATETIFPAVEGMLGETEYMKALEHVGARKDMSRYRSVVDFLFCEIFIEYRRRCFAWYEDEEANPRLKEILDEERRARYERWLVAALQMAYRTMDEKRTLSWTKYRVEVLKIAA